jgi:hypothetical protein
MNIPAIAGPMEAPIKLKSTVIPKISHYTFGVDFRTISHPPTLIRDIPAATIARFIATKNSVE